MVFTNPGSIMPQFAKHELNNGLHVGDQNFRGNGEYDYSFSSYFLEWAERKTRSAQCLSVAVG